MADFTVTINSSDNKVIVNEQTNSLVVISPTANNVTIVSDGIQGPAGTTDHGSLTGLSDDDHTQYLTTGRADTWLATKTTSNLTEGSNLYFTDERAQDAIGAALTDSSTIDFTYNDGSNTISASVTQSGIDHGSISGLSDDDHTQYHNDSRANTWLATKSTSDLSEGSNLYYTDARAKAAAVADAINNGTTDVAPSQNAVFDALALKQPLDTQLTDLAALSYSGNAGKVVKVKATEDGWELGVGGGGGGAWGTITGTLSDQTDLQSALDAKEDESNKSTDGTFAANSTTLYPSQSAVKTYADTKMAIAGGTFTGTVIPSVVTLTDAATIAVNATLGNQFTCTITASRTLGNPTGAINGQLMLFAIRQNGTGGYTLSFDTKYRFGDEIGTPAIATGADKTTYIGVRYHGTDDKFDVISFASNY